MKTEAFDKWQTLGRVNTPADLKGMSLSELQTLATEIREYLSFRVRENGGHLASNLGVVELTIAIHRVFDLPSDHLIFDVGHQSYVHKLLTGRKERFDTLREAGGISGFTKRAESEYDAFGAGHSSTAISAAIGMAQADLLAGKSAYTVAVVGDGALTGGLAYEGLNNCRPELPLLIIINENEMSISPNTGRLAAHLARMRASKNYLKTKEFTASALRYIPLIGKPIYRLLRRFKRWIKHLFYEENLFEHMGIRYLGPVDGNDLEGMIACLEHAKHLDTSVILHVKTKKGKGDAEAEEKPDYYHGVAPKGAEIPEKTFSSECGRMLTEMACADPQICAITAAMSFGTGLEPFRAAHPDRFFDVGIAEGHAVTFAAGLAAGGLYPVFAVYSTFLQRAVDQVIHDAALQRLPMLLCVDRAGFNAADGATHHGVFDVAYLAAIPNVKIFAPVTYKGLSRALAEARDTKGACVIRYPSGSECHALSVFEGEGPMGVRVYDSGASPILTIVTHGRIAKNALTVAEKLQKEGKVVRVLLCEYLAPFGELAAEVAPCLSGDHVLFYEEEIKTGGFGVNLADALSVMGALEKRSYRIVAAESAFATPLAGETVWQAAGVDEASLFDAAKELVFGGK